MLTVHTSHRSQSKIGRRELLKVGSLSLGGGFCSSLFSTPQALGSGQDLMKGKSVVLLFLQGGPPQIETFDPKFDGPSYSQSVTGDVGTSLPGIRMGGTFPKLSQMTDKLAIVRNYGVSTGGLSHENGYERVMTGGESLEETPMGSYIAKTIGSLHPTTGVPTNTLILPEAIDPEIVLGRPSGAFTFQQTKRYFTAPGRLGPEYAPFDPSGGSELLKNLELSIDRPRFDDRKALLTQLDDTRRYWEQTPEFQASSAYRLQAYDVLMRGISQAFDLSKEDAKTIARYDTGQLVPMKKIRRGGPLYWNNFNRTTNLLGKQMLLARRLCEAGCGFVTVIDSCWDFHDDGNNPPVKVGMDVLSPQLDHAVSTFLTDLEERGLSEKILLIITAEMGRSPKKGGKSGGGSGHWGQLTPLVFAGGGLKMGQVIGSSDRTGGKPRNDAYTPNHLMATVMNTIFDVGALRIERGVPNDLKKRLDDEPIQELF